MGEVRFADFKASVLLRSCPFGVPENLATTIDKQIVEALIQIQRYVPCYQVRHVDVYDQAYGTFTSCGATYFKGPRGKILSVRNRLKDSDVNNETRINETVKDDDCCVYDYDLVSEDEMRQVADEVKNLRECTLTSCRWRWGVYAVGAASIGISPPLKSTEQVEIAWRGLKREFGDYDLVPDEPELELAVSNYVMKECARLYDHDMEAAASATTGWNDTIGEMSYDCRENGGPHIEDSPEDNSALLTFTFVADGGIAGAAQSQVAALLEWINPDVLLFGGDNNYTTGSSSTIGANWAAYKKFIDRNAVFPALGNHDLDTEDGKPQLSFFKLPGNGRYYNFRRGHVEFFCINSGLNTAGAVVEPDGNTSGSVQGQWLQAALAASDATWKVVYFHHPPYTNGIAYSPGITDLRWPFGTWGADVVLSGHGHAYERLEVAGLPYFVVGTGGGALVGFIGSPTADSKKRYSADFGVLKVVADRQKLLFKFFNTARTLIDVFAITNP